MTVLQTERLSMRPPTESDVAPFVSYYVSARRAAAGRPKSAQEATEGFGQMMAHWRNKGFGRFIVECGGTVVGLIGPHQPKGFPEPELAWHIWLDAYEGKGLAFEAAEAARAYAYGDLGWMTAVSYIADDNTRSQRLAARLGAVLDRGAALLDVPEPHSVYRHPGPQVLQ